jgi:hypothetical protein
MSDSQNELLKEFGLDDVDDVPDKISVDMTPSEKILHHKSLDREWDRFKNDIEKNGILEPIIIDYRDGKLQIAEGNHRLTAANELELEDVPIVYTDNVPKHLKQKREIDIYHGSPNKFDLKDYDINKAQSGNLGKGIYVVGNKNTLIEKRSNTGNYGSKKYKNIIKSKTDGNLMYFKNFKTYRDSLRRNGFDESNSGKDAFNRQLKHQGFDGIKVNTAGHKDQIMLFDTSTIK